MIAEAVVCRVTSVRLVVSGEAAVIFHPFKKVVEPTFLSERFPNAVRFTGVEVFILGNSLQLAFQRNVSSFSM